MSQNKIHIAVVDDDESFAKAICRLLRAAGFVPDLYASAETFLDSEPLPQPACLVLDIQLGSMSGLELQRRLRELGAATPIIFVTAHDEPDARAQARDAGCTGYFRKPVRAQSLLDAIRKALPDQPVGKSTEPNE